MGLAIAAVKITLAKALVDDIHQALLLSCFAGKRSRRRVHQDSRDSPPERRTRQGGRGCRDIGRMEISTLFIGQHIILNYVEVI